MRPCGRSWRPTPRESEAELALKAIELAEKCRNDVSVAEQLTAVVRQVTRRRSDIMFIETLTLTNFRQFRGKHTLRFAHGRKNVTVVFGENGRGKTGLYRALMFCLFGDRQLSQDGTAIDEREVHLVNTAAVQESRDDKNKPVEAWSWCSRTPTIGTRSDGVYSQSSGKMASDWRSRRSFC